MSTSARRDREAKKVIGACSAPSLALASGKSGRKGSKLAARGGGAVSYAAMTSDDTKPLFRRRALERRFDATAATLDGADFVHRRTFEELTERLAPMQLDPRLVLDLGSGTGRIGNALAKRWRRARVINLDLSLRMLNAGRRGRSWFSRTRDVQADAHALPFTDGSFDMVISNLAPAWFAEPERAFAEVARVLRKEGLFIFAVPGPDTLRELGSAWRAADGSTHIHPFADMHDIGDALQRAGMSDPVLDVERLTVTYEDPQSLYRDLRRSGATNLLATRPAGLTGRRHFADFEAGLRTQAAGDRIGITVELVYGHAWGGGRRQSPQEFRVEASSIGRRQRKT